MSNKSRDLSTFLSGLKRVDFIPPYKLLIFMKVLNATDRPNNIVFPFY